MYYDEKQVYLSSVCADETGLISSQKFRIQLLLPEDSVYLYNYRSSQVNINELPKPT